MHVQACSVEEFLSSPSAAKLEHLGEDRGKILVEFLGVSVCVCVGVSVCSCIYIHSYSCDVKFLQKCGVARFDFLLPRK